MRLIAFISPKDIHVKKSPAKKYVLPQTEPPKKRPTTPTRCSLCKFWMLPAEHIRAGQKRQYVERMPAPNAGHCVTCWAAKQLGLPGPAVDLLKRAAVMLARLGAGPEGHFHCYIGKNSKEPHGNGATKHRHGCTCGLTEVLEGLQTLGLAIPCSSTPGFTNY